MRIRLTVAAALVAVSAALGACSNSQGDGLDLTTPKPNSSSPSTPSPSPTETATVSADEQAVLDAYHAFYAALEKANADPAKSAEYLSQVTTGEQFERTNSAIKANFLAGEETVGTPVLRPTTYSIANGTAIVHDCQDTTGVVRREIGTNEPLVIGRNPDSVKTILNLVDGKWKVAATEFQESAGAFC